MLGTPCKCSFNAKGLAHAAHSASAPSAAISIACSMRSSDQIDRKLLMSQDTEAFTPELNATSMRIPLSRF